jgi:hypothetical protein
LAIAAKNAKSNLMLQARPWEPGIAGRPIASQRIKGTGREMAHLLLTTPHLLG